MKFNKNFFTIIAILSLNNQALYSSQSSSATAATASSNSQTAAKDAEHAQNTQIAQTAETFFLEKGLFNKFLVPSSNGVTEKDSEFATVQSREGINLLQKEFATMESALKSWHKNLPALKTFDAKAAKVFAKLTNDEWIDDEDTDLPDEVGNWLLSPVVVKPTPEQETSNHCTLSALLNSPRAIITSYLIAFTPDQSLYIRKSFDFSLTIMHERSFKTFLCHGVGVNSRGKFGETPLMAAAAGGVIPHKDSGMLMSLRTDNKCSAQEKAKLARRQRGMMLFALYQGADSQARIEQAAKLEAEDGFQNNENERNIMPKKGQTALDRAKLLKHKGAIELLEKWNQQ